MKNKLNLNVLIIPLLIVSFTACGGGGDNGSTISNPPPVINKISFSGVAIDGYISGATACLDLNVNGSCDTAEPITQTATDGTFTFTNIEVDKDILLPIIVTGGIDTATGKVFRGELKRIVDTKSINNSVKLSVTPLTDLVASSYIASSNKSAAILTQTRSNVAFSLGLTVTDIGSDPMKNKARFAKTQEVQQIKELILTSSLKSTNTTSDSEQAKRLKKNIVIAIAKSIQENGGIVDTTKVIQTLEVIDNDVTIPTNEKEFIALQVHEIKKTLDIMLTDTTVTVDSLNQQQSNLEDRVEVASSNIKQATVDSTITVVTKNTPIVVSIPTPPAPPAL